MDFMSNWNLPVSSEVALTILGSLITIVTAFFAKLFGLLELSFTRKEREADAAMDNAKALEILAAQIIKSGDRADQLFDRVVAMGERQDAEREMFRQRELVRIEQHTTQIKSLEKSLIDGQEEIKNYHEKVNTLSEMVQKLAIENEGKDRTIDSLNRRITTLEESEKQAHHLVIQKDYKITELEKRLKELEPLEKRVKELEAEIQRLKEQQKPQPIEATVTIVDTHPTDGQPTTPPVAPEQGADVVPSQDSEVVS
jgi:predicted RNase H-like nuclease (RuvC/YqgF family)